MQEAKVLAVDDSYEVRRSLAEGLPIFGHTVVLEAGDFATVSRLIEGGYLESQGVTVAVLDGNLTMGDITCMDGHVIAQRIRERKPDVKIIAFTTCRRNVANYGDAYTDNFRSIPDIIAKL